MTRTLAAAAFAVLLALVPAAAPADDALAGQALFLRRCAACHGPDGAGDGPARAWLESPPRDLRTGFLDRYATPELVERLRSGARLAIEFDPEAIRQRSADTEALVAYLGSLPRTDWARVDRGSFVYLQRCESCHGVWGAPPAALPAGVAPIRDLASSAFQKSHSDSELLTAVRHGRKGMPALVPRIEEAEALDLVRFVRQLSPGYVIWQQTCVNCHGERGNGVGSFVESMQLPSVTLDAAWFARTDPDDLRLHIWHMLDDHRPRMPHFGEQLGEEEARRIILYLQSRPALPAAATPAAGR